MSIQLDIITAQIIDITLNIQSDISVISPKNSSPDIQITPSVLTNDKGTERTQERNKKPLLQPNIQAQEELFQRVPESNSMYIQFLKNQKLTVT